MPIKTKRLDLLEETEKALNNSKSGEPLRRTKEEFKGMPSIIPQKELPVSTRNKPPRVRWRTVQELKAQRGRLEEQRVKENLKELKKMKWKGARSAQLMPRRTALMNSQLARNSAEGSTEVHDSLESKPLILLVVDE